MELAADIGSIIQKNVEGRTSWPNVGVADNHSDSLPKSQNNPLPLRRWMAETLNSCGAWPAPRPRHEVPVILSQEYIKAVIKIGFFIADTISEAEQNLDLNESHDKHQAITSAVPDANSDWADQITVFLEVASAMVPSSSFSINSNNAKNTLPCASETNGYSLDCRNSTQGIINIEPLSESISCHLVDTNYDENCCSSINSGPSLLTHHYDSAQDWLEVSSDIFDDSCAGECDLTDNDASQVERAMMTSNNFSQSTAGDVERSSPKINADTASHGRKQESVISEYSLSEYCAVTSVTFSPESSSTNSDEKLGRIRALGIVLFELFSGGRKLRIEDVSFTSGVTCAGRSVFENLTVDDSKDDCSGQLVTKHGLPKDPCFSSRSTGFASINLLHMMGLPFIICDTVANMVNCTMGEFVSDKAYHSISEVKNDLKLMLSRADLFFCNVHDECLNLSETLNGHESELGSIADTFDRCVTDGYVEVVTISGLSGVGKSRLVEHVSELFVGREVMFISGKFDKRNQNAPFSVLSGMFNEWCDFIIRKGHAVCVRNEILKTLGNDAYILCAFITDLSKILGASFERNILLDNSANSHRRMQYFLYRFVEIVSNIIPCSIKLFFDDVHNADSASLELIYKLIVMLSASKQRKQILAISSYCDEIPEDHQFLSILLDFAKFGVNVTKIQLSKLGANAVNDLISGALRLLPRLTQPLANIIHHNTDGNPTLVIQALKLLVQEELLYFNTELRRWLWSEDKILSRITPNHIVNILTNKISALPPEVQSALSTAACFGSNIEVSIISRLEETLKQTIFEFLDVAVSEGLLYKTRNRRYLFVHDSLQQAAYELIKPEDRSLHHFRYGSALCVCSDKAENPRIFFVGVDQLNRGGPSAIADKSTSVKVADLNLQAGIKALSASDFSVAFSFFDNGISFLRKGHWREHYDLSLELFNYAAKSSFSRGDNTSLYLISEQVLTFANSFEDKLNILFVNFVCLTYALEISQAIQKGVSALSQLGVELPRSFKFPDGTLSQYLDATHSLLTEINDDELLNYTLTSNPKHKMAMKFLSHLSIVLFLYHPEIQPIISMIIIQKSISHGMSPHSPMAFSCYGSLLAFLGNLSDGYRFTKIALKQLDSVDFDKNECASCVCLIAGELVPFVEDVSSSLEIHLRGFNLGIENGDINNAFGNMSFYNTYMYWSGNNLAKALKLLEDSFVMMERHHHHLYYYCSLPLYWTVVKMMGNNKMGTGKKRSNRCISEEEESSLIKNHLHRRNRAFNAMYIAFIFRIHDDLENLAENFLADNTKFWLVSLVTAYHTLYFGLVSYQLARQSKNQYWIERGDQALESVRTWARSSKRVFINKVYLMDAERSFACGDREKAIYFYEGAISHSQENMFLNEEALSRELAGYFVLESSNDAEAMKYFQSAIDCYRKWGAEAKADALDEIIKNMFTSSSTLTGWDNDVYETAHPLLKQQN